eukprot:GEMP01079813.1.p1 GENE.GEMP01079813.1~~GEMP01079813.1.p1  ORF type:complete len:112 (-),score=8.10 GEMP01079813.1:102-437(-)
MHIGRETNLNSCSTISREAIDDILCQIHQTVRDKRATPCSVRNGRNARQQKTRYTMSIDATRIRDQQTVSNANKKVCNALREIIRYNKKKIYIRENRANGDYGKYGRYARE